ncbi:MAG TPA: NADH-quinone oxidoreductase subunit J [Anaerolineae bacterium]|nr:NADH-quinone oxidoreductase subunit J [Anaerolineae bacterium]
MSADQLIFLFFALLLLAGAAAVVTMRNLFHAAQCMAFCFFAVAGLFVLLQADFLAVVAVLLGIGAIAILIIFAIMLTRGVGVGAPGLTRRWPLALAIVVILFGLLTIVFTGFAWSTTQPPPVGDDAIEALGIALVDPNQYLLPFEVAGVMLVATLIGSIYIARGRK